MKTNERGIETVTNEITELVNQVAREARKEALDEVLHMLITKADIMRNVINNSIAVSETAYGERFDKLYNQRSIVWGHLHQLYNLTGYIYDLKAKE